MKKSLFLLAVLSSCVAGFAQPKPIEGRWDLTITKDGSQLPAWLEVRHSGFNMLVGRFVYAFGSARPVSEVKWRDGTFSFAIPPQWEPGSQNLSFEGAVSGDHLKGTMTYTDGKTSSFVGQRAPRLQRDAAPVWGAPIALIGKDLSNWKAEGKNQWMVEDGVLKSPASGVNLYTEKTFTDFKLHVEFRYPKGSNSGVYLRGRYEVQISDGLGLEPMDDQFSGVYGFLAPNQMVAKAPGEWQSYDITLIGRTVTIVANGVTVICDQVIPGITGGALDSREGEPGPILLQGDHGPIEYRNMVLTPAK
jgi:hypothetical protein